MRIITRLQVSPSLAWGSSLSGPSRGQSSRHHACRLSANRATINIHLTRPRKEKINNTMLWHHRRDLINNDYLHKRADRLIGVAHRSPHHSDICRGQVVIQQATKGPSNERLFYERINHALWLGNIVDIPWSLAGSAFSLNREKEREAIQITIAISELNLKSS